MTEQRRISVGAMALLTEEMRHSDPHRVTRWFERNKADFQREELLQLCDELLIGISICMNADEAMDMLNNVAVELDETYEESYEEMQEDEEDV